MHPAVRRRPTWRSAGTNIWTLVILRQVMMNVTEHLQQFLHALVQMYARHFEAEPKSDHIEGVHHFVTHYSPHVARSRERNRCVCHKFDNRH